MKKIRVTIWNEFRHEKEPGSKAQQLYPNGIHAAMADFLGECKDLKITLAALDDPDQGIPDEVLDNTDVLIWWGHCHHKEVRDDRVEYIKHRVFSGGMGFIACHSAHKSKPFTALVGTSGNLSWGAEIPEILWTIQPAHPIAQGIPEHFELEKEELYAEPFFIPTPDDLIFGAWYPSGHLLRAGVTYKRGMGKVFYFQPGHEECGSYYNKNVQTILKNAVHWCAPKFQTPVEDKCPCVDSVYNCEK